MRPVCINLCRVIFMWCAQLTRPLCVNPMGTHYKVMVERTLGSIRGIHGILTQYTPGTVAFLSHIFLEWKKVFWWKQNKNFLEIGLKARSDLRGRNQQQDYFANQSTTTALDSFHLSNFCANIECTFLFWHRPIFVLIFWPKLNYWIFNNLPFGSCDLPQLYELPLGLAWLISNF